MRIATLNSINTRGLWGETLLVNNMSNSNSRVVISNYETKHYYPFGDESLEEVNNVLKENSTYKTLKEESSDVLFIKEVGTNISIKQPLLFSAKQWMKYIANKLAIGGPEYRLIEQNLKSLHLERYLHI